MDKKLAACSEKKKKSEGDKEVGVAEAEAEKEEEVVLPGFRFHPTDEELVGFYLRRKVDNKPVSIEIIKQIDIYKYDPCDLPKASTVGGEKEWYFFCLRGRKYRNSIRPNRVTGSGFWKATGIDRPIYSTSDDNDCIGLKKSLVYYRGSAGKGTKTDWMMHEFRLPSSNKDNESCSPSMQEAEIWTICRIFKRNVSFKRHQEAAAVAASTKHNPDSSSKTSSSFESDTGDEYQYLGCASVHDQQGDRRFTNYFEERNQCLGGQWIAPAAVEAVQAPALSTTLMQTGANAVASPNTNEAMKDGSWDELGRIMEYYSMVDPSATHEYRYY